MKAFQLDDWGLENLKCVDVSEPEAGPREVVVKWRAASINYRDYLICTKGYNPNLPMPITPLSDGAGEVVAVGPGVTSLQVGDHVCSTFWPQWETGDSSFMNRMASTGADVPGVAREYSAIDERALVKAPKNLSFTEAATLPCAALTAWAAMTTNSGVGPGDKVLSLGTGGVALFALQFAKALGAKAAITSSSDRKLDKAIKLGADYTVNYKDEPEWGAKIAEKTEGGVNCVVETGGIGTLGQSANACAFNGNINLIGQFTGFEAPLNAGPLVFKNLSIHGCTVGNRDDFEKMVKCIESFDIHPVIDRTFGFDEIPEALATIHRGGHFGKLVVSYD